MTEFSKDYQPENEAKAVPKKSKKCRDALMIALERQVEIDGEMTRRVVQIAEALCKKAAEGDVQAAREIFDRVDGKVPVAVGGSDELPSLLSGITVQFVKSDSAVPE
jgi:hypothetical protein